MSDFDWDSADVVIPEQPRTAIFTNDDGQVVVRQHCWPDDDVVVVISPPHAITVALAILRAAGHDDIEFIRNCGAGFEDVELPELPSPRKRPNVEEMKAARPDIDWDRATADFDEFAAKTAPKDPTAAERQRRRRDKLRDSHAKSVTSERDTAPVVYGEVA
ncbi:hypothetical protein [Bradyrhizobium sp. 6(2017)]|uniref:hypothetical protein n=1 Tax=Bradyrhizobium sp. 6(2017) TaxID=1197460 RepID=UPI0013E1EF26|nr:hypothetical protein [Bradyrhizobium sp. 6(2017)]QIG91973.1 hypothetical protein G6P99_05290 [Bradyrhizobium sp. 6(2017)]